MSVDLLVFAPHPDDAEIGLGGTIARHTAEGFAVGLCDLTAGEMGTNGTVDERLAEGDKAANVLGVAWRENLRWRDRAIDQVAAYVDQAAAFVRRHTPRVVAIPYWSDRHPDHVAASKVLTEAIFNAGLRRYPVEGEAWKVEWVCYYFLNDSATPSFVVDVTDYYDKKRAALDCHVTQFTRWSETAETRLNSPLFRQRIESRDAQFGALAGVNWAEGIIVREPVERPNLMRAISRR